MLYSRLENRRMKNKEAKENTKERPRKQLQPLRELKVRVRPMLVDSSFLKTWAILFVVRFSINTLSGLTVNLSLLRFKYKDLMTDHLAVHLEPDELNK